MRKLLDTTDAVVRTQAAGFEEPSPFRHALMSASRPRALKPVAQQQFDAFVATARSHGCDKGEGRFEQVLRRLFPNRPAQDR